MEMEACNCGGLPAHDHYIDYRRPTWVPVWDQDDIGRIWVRWKDVARALIIDSHTGRADG
jgi:hypothetical protein